MLSSCTFSRCFGKLYSKTHEWIELAGKVGTVGISDYAQHHLGDIVFADVQVGRESKAGEDLGDLESVKATSPIMAPMSGKVIEVNKAIADNPAIINQSPEKDGWIAKIEVSNESEASTLMDEAAYKKFLSSSH